MKVPPKNERIDCLWVVASGQNSTKIRRLNMEQRVSIRTSLAV
jgi:hypothetical protein